MDGAEGNQARTMQLKKLNRRWEMAKRQALGKN
jgi:hypothetical protein